MRALSAGIYVIRLKLLDAAKVHVNTIRAMEASGANGISGRAQNVQAVQRALEGRGIEFLNHGKPGVRLVGDRADD
ncbi:hypothetical protein ACCT19_35305 [Rhizobium ruizarguesonis]